MKKYQIMLLGENFLLNFLEWSEKSGFYTTIWVEADDENDAELKAVDTLRSQDDLKSGLLNAQDDPPMVYLEELKEIETKATLKGSGGRVFFQLEDEEARIEAKKLVLEVHWS